jgi:thiol-disulfide isomerase/thioredoxin
VLAALAALTINTNAATLGIGDAAPELKISKWVKGGPVTALESNKTYVVEFWATWCAPCRQSIPHLTEMAHKYTNVTFIGVDVLERGTGIDANVAKFVKQMGDKMDYHVAMDTENAFMVDRWLKAAELGSIPAAFLIQNGKIIWIGHPMAGLQESLNDVAAGKFDIEKAKKRIEAQKKLEAFYMKAIKGGDEAGLAREAKELEALDKELGGITPGKPLDIQELIKQAKFESALAAYQMALLSGKDETETAKLQAAARAVTPKGENFDEIDKQVKQYINQAKEAQKAQNLFVKYLAAVGENGDKAKAADLAKQIEALSIKDPQTLNNMAWAILTDESIKQRDLALATKLAKASVDATEGKEPTVLDTYARALFDSGKVADAIEVQKKAVAACQDESDKSELSATLKKYQAATGNSKASGSKSKQ